MSDHWFLSRAGERHGPYGWDDLVRFARDGNIAADDLIWSASTVDWVRADTVSGFLPVQPAHQLPPVPAASASTPAAAHAPSVPASPHPSVAAATPAHPSAIPASPVPAHPVPVAAYAAASSAHPAVASGGAISFGHWLGVLIILLIPVLNLLMLLVWSCAANVNPSKQSFARAALLVAAVLTLVTLILALTGSAALFRGPAMVPM